MISLIEKEIAKEYLINKNPEALQDIPEERIAIVWEYIDNCEGIVSSLMVIQKETVNITSHPVFSKDFQEDNLILDQFLSVPETDIAKFKFLSGELESRLTNSKIESGGEKLQLKTYYMLDSDSDSESIQEAIGEIRSNMDHGALPKVKMAWEDVNDDMPELENVDFKGIIGKVDYKDLQIQQVYFTDIYSSDSHCPYWTTVKTTGKNKAKKSRRKSKLKLEFKEDKCLETEISDLSSEIIGELDFIGKDSSRDSTAVEGNYNYEAGVDSNHDPGDEIAMGDVNYIDQENENLEDDVKELDQDKEKMGKVNDIDILDEIDLENLEKSMDDTGDLFQDNREDLLQENYELSNYHEIENQLFELQKENNVDVLVYYRKNRVEGIQQDQYHMNRRSLLERKNRIQRNQVPLKEITSEKIKQKRKNRKEKHKKNQKISTTIIKSKKAFIQPAIFQESTRNDIILSDTILSDMIRDAPNRHDLPMPEYDWNISCQRGSLEDFDSEVEEFESQYANVAIQVTPKSDSTIKNDEFIKDKSVDALDPYSIIPNTVELMDNIGDDRPSNIFTSFALRPNEFNQHGLIHSPPTGFTYVCTLGYTPFSHSPFPIYILVPIDHLDTSVKSYFDSLSRDMFDVSLAESFLSKSNKF